MGQRQIDSHLRADQLFAPGRPPVHVNRPLHQGHTPLHDHDFYELAIVLDGKAVHRDVHGTTAVTRGQLILVQPGHWHAYEACRDLQLVNVVFAARLVHHHLAWAVADGHLAAIVAPRPAIGLHQHPDPDGLDAVIRALQAILPDGNRPQVIGQLLTVLGHVTQVLPDAPAWHLPEALGACLAAIEDDLTREWALPDLATIAGCDPSYLGRLCRRHLRSSPIAWLHRRRAERAAVLLLTTELSITTIGQRVGWGDPNYFARRFRAVFSQSPSAYRQQLPMPAGQALTADWLQWHGDAVQQDVTIGT